jgi:serine/threonine protein phosphatase PrpC
MSMRASQINNRGGREYNEDAWQTARGRNSYCYVVADGLGGHGGGDIAARKACEGVIQSYRNDDRVCIDALSKHFRAAEAAVRAEQSADGNRSRMRTTLVILLLNTSHAIWGYIGDSRLYHFRAGRVIDQTKDHSVPQTMVDAGELRPEQIRHHEDRNRLLRVVGADDDARPAMLSAAVPLRRGDAFLLCSDGFWEYVEELEMEADFAKARQPQDWLSFMETRLQERVDGTNDNYTAVGIFADSTQVPVPDLPPTKRAPSRRPSEREVKITRVLKRLVLVLGVIILTVATFRFLPDHPLGRFGYQRPQAPAAPNR